MKRGKANGQIIKVHCEMVTHQRSKRRSYGVPGNLPAGTPKAGGQAQEQATGNRRVDRSQELSELPPVQRRAIRQDKSRPIRPSMHAHMHDRMPCRKAIAALQPESGSGN